MTIDEMIEVLQAAKAGKKIQARAKSDREYPWDKVASPNWNFEACEFRVAPDPFGAWWESQKPSDGWAHLVGCNIRTSAIEARTVWDAAINSTKQ